MIVDLGRASGLTRSLLIGYGYDGGAILPFLRIIPL